MRHFGVLSPFGSKKVSQMTTFGDLFGAFFAYFTMFLSDALLGFVFLQFFSALRGVLERAGRHKDPKMVMPILQPYPEGGRTGGPPPLSI